MERLPWIIPHLSALSSLTLSALPVFPSYSEAASPLEHCAWVHVKSLQSCLTLCHPMDCCPSGFSVHGDSPGRNTGVGCHVLLSTWSASWEICMQVRKQQLELDMEQQTGSKEQKGYVKTVYCHLAYLTYMQSTSWDTLGWRKHKLESRLPREISITPDMQMNHP